jgi:hypothetical protein
MMARARAKAEAEAKAKMAADPRLAKAKADAEAKAEAAKAKAQAKAAEMDAKHGLSDKATAAEAAAMEKAAAAKKAADIKAHGKVAELFYEYDADASGYLDGATDHPAYTFRVVPVPAAERAFGMRAHRGRGDRVLRYAGAEVHPRRGLPGAGRDGDGR